MTIWWLPVSIHLFFSVACFFFFCFFSVTLWDSMCVHPWIVFACLHAVNELCGLFQMGIFEWQLLMFLLLNGKKIWTCICQCSLSFSLPFKPCSSALQTAAPPPVTKLVSEACYECLTTCYPFYSILSLCICVCLLHVIPKSKDL